MYIFQPRQPILKPYIKKIHYFTLDSLNLSLMTAIPTGNVFLSVFWGCGEYVTQRPNSAERTEKGGVFISGQQFEIAHHWVKEGKMNIIGFELTPHAIHQFFDVPQEEITGKVLKLEDIWSGKASALYQQVIHEPDPVKRLEIIERFLCERIVSDEWKDNKSIDQAIFLIHQSKGNISVKQLAGSLRISTRSLERRFLQAVGISPKSFCKIIQFNNAFKLLARSNKQILDVVSEAGYYDQPHFTNHFRKVFGISPGQFFEENENFLYNFKNDNDQYAFDSLYDLFHQVNKLYVF
ncbi:hypothetical protein BH23BAC2_BH23BAC2_03370 [soil metagenome]